jgi:hypothetical protein
LYFPHFAECLILLHNRNISKLLDSIEPVLDDPAKLCILHYMSDLLPDSEQTEFDRAAAKIFDKQSDGK